MSSSSINIPAAVPCSFHGMAAPVCGQCVVDCCRLLLRLGSGCGLGWDVLSFHFDGAAALWPLSNSCWISSSLLILRNRCDLECLFSCFSFRGSKRKPATERSKAREMRWKGKDMNVCVLVTRCKARCCINTAVKRAKRSTIKASTTALPLIMRWIPTTLVKERNEGMSLWMRQRRNL